MRERTVRSCSCSCCSCYHVFNAGAQEPNAVTYRELFFALLEAMYRRLFLFVLKLSERHYCFTFMFYIHVLHSFKFYIHVLHSCFHRRREDARGGGGGQFIQSKSMN